VGISYFGDNAEEHFPEADYVHRSKGGKWDGIYKFFKQFPEAAERYDYFWLPDDDISATAEDINRLLQIGARSGYHVFQPALNEHSFHSHLITLEHPSFEVRYTNFVEVMVPVISREILIRTLPLLENTRSGFGLDFVWPRMVEDIVGEQFQGVAIIDSVTVCHTRPVGGSLHQFMSKTNGRSALEEMAATMIDVTGVRSATINGVKIPRIRIFAGVARGGRRLTGHRLVIRVAIDLLRRHINRSQPIGWYAALKHALKAGV
jgi:hypothetical protein